MLTCHSQDQQFGGVEVRHLNKNVLTLIDNDSPLQGWWGLFNYESVNESPKPNCY